MIVNTPASANSDYSMTRLQLLITRFYDKVILERPVIVIACILAVVAFLGYWATEFRLDASAETLVLENDKDLQYSRIINSRYEESDYLVIAYTPEGDLFSVETLANLRQLRDELKKLKRVSSVVSILDVPLLESPPVPVRELASNIRTLDSPSVDLELARVESRESPIYQNLLVSPDLRTTALQVKFSPDEIFRDLLARRNNFREKQAENPLTAEENAEFKKVKGQFQRHRDKMRKIRHQYISAVRAIMYNHRQDGKLFLGGISMIADDLINFIKNDLKIFGLGVLFFLVVTLRLIFRRLRWIVLPLLCCAFSVISMMGFLGMFGWEVTVISSNFISLQLIITMAITIHLIVRYRELHSVNPEDGHRKNILDAVRLMMKPCFYAALTTIAGFGSLVLCDILPVINFGWMMIAGIIVSLILTFLFFPAGLMLVGEGTPSPQHKNHRFSLTSVLARFTE
ncbi:MAG: MMPL family transporter, partial [Deltaproteobacteria bacterium]|nr:MMPL family transporter [Deltaproteobacteria bacterium]